MEFLRITGRACPVAIFLQINAVRVFGDYGEKLAKARPQQGLRKPEATPFSAFQFLDHSGTGADTCVVSKTEGHGDLTLGL
jgi:hypothetical protein